LAGLCPNACASEKIRGAKQKSGQKQPEKLSQVAHYLLPLSWEGATKALADRLIKEKRIFEKSLMPSL
jgi:hypothetical protein